MDIDIINELVIKFLNKPYHIGQGAGYLSKLFGCTKEEVYEARRIIRNKQNEEDQKELFESSELPKILILDIETAPMKAYVWQRWQQNVYLDQTISEWFIITWSAKWLYGDEIISAKLSPKELIAENDLRIMLPLWDLLNVADMVVTHHGDRFDIPRINAAFLQHNIMPPSPYRSIDTKKVVKGLFGFSSNKLDAIARMFDIPVKLETDMMLWVRCMNGEQAAIDEMSKYNDHDVEIEEEVYLLLRPWIKSHPNVGLYMDTDDEVCPHCGSLHVDKIKDKYYYTNTGKFETYRCDSCSAVSRKRRSTIHKPKKLDLLVPLPR